MLILFPRRSEDGTTPADVIYGHRCHGQGCHGLVSGGVAIRELHPEMLNPHLAERY